MKKEERNKELRGLIYRISKIIRFKSNKLKKVFKNRKNEAIVDMSSKHKRDSVSSNSGISIKKTGTGKNSEYS
ncbi:MAG: hypothetical protein LBL71_03240 [Endomicrobium sp.]|jgi:hypothetical protein|nr:hypothetical protein [Endomicrobium sp.]